MPVDYSRFDNIDTDSDTDGDADARRAPQPSDANSPSAQPRPPDNVMEDLEDYFERLDARRAEAEAASSAAPFGGVVRDEDVAAAASVERFAEAELEQLERSTGPGERAGGGAGECAICLGTLGDAEECLVLPCAARHRFHAECARSWLSRGVTCPLCRVDVRSLVRTAWSGSEAGTAEVAEAAEAAAQPIPLSPRSFGFTRDGGVITRYVPRPPPELPRPAYIPPELRGVAELVEIDYPDRGGTARVWRIPR